jgi:hypothetical protein
LVLPPHKVWLERVASHEFTALYPLHLPDTITIITTITITITMRHHHYCCRMAIYVH